jgi:PAS domain S-box-containing protein
VVETYQSWRKSGISGIQVERTALRKDGARFDAHINGNMVALQDEVVEIAFFTDTSERKRNELELAKYRQHLEELVKERTEVQKLLAEEKELLSTTLMSIAEGVIVTDPDGLITLFNHSAEKITGYSLNEATGSPIHSILQLRDSSTLEILEDTLRSLLELEKIQKNGGNYRAPTLTTRWGTRLLVLGGISTLKSVKSDIVGYVIVFQDVTEKQRLESQTILSQKWRLLASWHPKLPTRSIPRSNTLVTI